MMEKAGVLECGITYHIAQDRKPLAVVIIINDKNEEPKNHFNFNIVLGNKVLVLKKKKAVCSFFSG